MTEGLEIRQSFCIWMGLVRRPGRMRPVLRNQILVEDSRTIRPLPMSGATI